MTKIIPATCENGKVTADGVEVPDVQILGAGVKSSSGLLIIADDSAPVYIVSNSTDLDQTLADVIQVVTDVAAALTTITTSLTSLAAGMHGPTTAPPPTLPTDVADITAKVASLNTTKTDLQNLKGELT